MSCYIFVYACKPKIPHFSQSQRYAVFLKLCKSIYLYMISCIYGTYVGNMINKKTGRLYVRLSFPDRTSFLINM